MSSPLSPSLDEVPPPPDSWPGAAGRRSVAPEVPSWPGAPVSREAPGGGWPGAQVGAADAGRPSGSPAATPAGGHDDAPPGGRVPGGVAAILFPAIVGVVLLLLLGLWASLDDGSRSAQVVTLVVVVVGVLGALLASAWRHRR